MLMNLISLRTGAIALVTLCLAACGADTVRYPIGGTISGLSGAGLVLANQSESLPVSANGSFAFTTQLASGASYAVTIKIQPIGQVCTVANGTGTVGTAAVTNATVTCVAAPPMSLLSTNPANGSTNVARTIVPTLTFSVAVSVPTGAADLTLQSAAGSHPLTASAAGSTLTVTPARKLLPLTSYTLTAGVGVRGAAGDQLPGPAQTAFTTADSAWQPSALLAPETPDQTFDPRLAMNAKGNAIAVWRQYDGTNMRTMSRLYSANVGWGPISMVQGSTGIAPVQGLVLDASDNAIAVWETSDSVSCGEDRTCARYKVWTSRFVPASGWGEPKLMANAVASTGMQPRIAMNSEGEALLVWAENDGTRTNIWARRYTVDDGWIGSVKIETDPGAASDPQVAVDESGNAMAIWRQGSTIDDIWANRYTAGGGWGTAVRIEGNTEFAANPHLAISASGNASATWLQYDGTGSNMWFNTFSASAGWGAPQLVADHAENATNPAVATDASGNSLLVWQELYHAGPVFRVNIWSRRYVAGAGLGAATLLVNVAQADPVQLVMDESGNAIAAWSQKEVGPSSVWSARYTANSGWAAPMLLETDDAGDANLRTELAMNSSGDATVVWHQFDGPTGSGGRMHAYYRRFD